MAAAHSLQETVRRRQEETTGRYCRRPRIVGLYLGYRGPDRSQVPAPDKGGLAWPTPAISSSAILSHLRHPSRLPAARSARPGRGPAAMQEHSFLRRGNGRLCSGRFSGVCFCPLRSSAGDRTSARGKENPPTFYAVRSSSPTRVPSPRQLPTDHDCAVSTRGYQSDQPSHLPLVLSPALLSSGLVQLSSKTKAALFVNP